MGEMFLKVLLIMAVLFAFMAPGFVLRKLKMIGEGATFALSNLLLYVCQPALAIKAFCVFTKDDWTTVSAVNKFFLLENFGMVAAISIAAILLMFALCKLIFIKCKNKKITNVYSFVAVFSNSGFLGIPFIDMFTDGDPLAVMYMMVFNVIFTILCWTLGVVLITGDYKQIKFRKLVCNPALIANAVGLLLFFVPKINFFMFDGLEVLQIFPQYLANMTAPLSMVIVGIRVAEMSPKTLFLKKGVYLAGALRQIISPLLTFAVAVPFYFLLSKARGGVSAAEDYVFLAPIIAMAMSPAASVAAMAESFDGDKETAAAAFVTVTLLSIIVIPLVVTAIMAGWGLAAATVAESVFFVYCAVELVVVYICLQVSARAEKRCGFGAGKTVCSMRAVFH